MIETVRLLEAVIIEKRAASATDAVQIALCETTEWLSLREKTELYKLAEVQYKNKEILSFFVETS